METFTETVMETTNFDKSCNASEKSFLKVTLKQKVEIMLFVCEKHHIISLIFYIWGKFFSITLDQAWKVL